ncbi:heat shock factor protein 5-like [Lathamus discolor]|uniref:heat shock factor protein 5-like n=1 Tax=Lathamus discolor TaxID=678569 RepID=UPI0032B816C1
MGPGVARRPVERERPGRPLSGSAMEGQRLPGAVNPSHFPAKLWQLVNSPRCGSVRWDARGEGLLIDQRLFERELLGAEPAGEGAALGADFFKTRNFASFIRQLNLYGFRKLGPGPGPGPLQDPAGGDGGSSAGPLLHFHSPHFRRDRPELLVRLKRLTRANKAKLAAGPELPSRPPQRSQRPPSALGEAARPGLVTAGQAPQPCRPASFFPYSNRAASCLYPPAFQATTSQQRPVPSRPWQGSVGSLPGHGASAAFPGPGAPFPVLHRCSTEVTYTLHTVFSLLPLQRGAPAAASLPEPGSCASPGQCLPGPDPTPTLQCLPPAQGGPLTVSASAAASTDCGFVQSPDVQPPSAAECPPSDGAHHASEGEEKLPEFSYQDVFEIFNEMCASRSADVVTPEPAESWDGELLESYLNAAIESAAAAETAQDSENASVECGSLTEERELPSGTEAAKKAAEEPGSPAKRQCRKRRQSSQQGEKHPQIPKWQAAFGQVGLSPMAAQLLRVLPATLQCLPPAQGGPLTVSASAAASTDCGFVQSPDVQPPSAAECPPSDGAHHASEGEEKLPEFSYQDVFEIFNEMCASRSADVENASVECGSLTEERELPSGTEAAKKAAEEPGSPAKRQCRKRRQSSQQGEKHPQIPKWQAAFGQVGLSPMAAQLLRVLPDPHEPEGGACKRGCFWRKTPE